MLPDPGSFASGSSSDDLVNTLAGQSVLFPNLSKTQAGVTLGDDFGVAFRPGSRTRGEGTPLPAGECFQSSEPARREMTATVSTALGSDPRPEGDESPVEVFVVGADDLGVSFSSDVLLECCVVVVPAGVKGFGDVGVHSFSLVAGV